MKETKNIMTVERGNLFINGQKFIPTNLGDDEIYEIDYDGRLVTLFRGSLGMQNFWYFEDLEGYFYSEKKLKDQAARNIVAFLINRKRQEYKRFNKVCQDKNSTEMEKLMVSISFVEQSNAAEYARRIYYGLEL